MAATPYQPIVPDGVLQVDSMKATYILQTTPSGSFTDFMVNLSKDNTLMFEGMKVDQISGCLTTMPIFVPHHQIEASIFELLEDINFEVGGITELPYLVWDYIDHSPETDYPEFVNVKPFLNTEMVFTVPEIFGGDFGDFVCEATLYEPDEDALEDFLADNEMTRLWNPQAQWVTFIFSRYNDDLDPKSRDDNPRGDLSFFVTIYDGIKADERVEYQFQLRVGAGAAPALGMTTDDWETFMLINPAVRPDGEEAKVEGNTTVEYTRYAPFNDDADYEGNIKDQAVQYIAVQIIYINYTLQFHIAGTSQPFVVPLTLSTPESIPVIAKIGIAGYWYRELRVSAHLGKWRDKGDLVASGWNVGTEPKRTPFYRVHGINDVKTLQDEEAWVLNFPKWTTFIEGPDPDEPVEITTHSIIVIGRPKIANDPRFQKGPLSIQQQYGLTIFNPLSIDDTVWPGRATWREEFYSHLTAAVTRASICIAGTHEPLDFAAPLSLAPKSIEETTSFDPEGLTIDHQMAFTLDNQGGQWRGLEGNKAVQLQFGYLMPPVGRTTRFTGIAHTYDYDRSGATGNTVRVTCSDHMMQLRKTFIFSPPDFDLWNQYAAIAWLAQYAGIHASKFAFAALVPIIDDTGNGATLADDPEGIIDPFAFAGGDPEPYFLPSGQGMHPWTPINRSQSVLQIMDFIRKPSSFMLFFDEFANLHYQKWIPPVPPIIDTTTPIFTQAPWAGPPLYNLALTEMFNLQVRSSTEPVRNQVFLMGVDAYGKAWVPVVSHDQDMASILDPSAPNFVGFRSPFVWVDSRFTNQAYADRARKSMLNFMRVPEYSAELEVYMQPGLYPMNLIHVYEDKSGIDTLPLYVTNVRTRYAIDGTNIRFRSYISARFITHFVEPPALIPPVTPGP